MKGTTRDAMAFPGHLGINIIRPMYAGDFYRIVFKFDSMRHYINWESSDVRQEWLKRYAEVTVGEAEQEVLSGLETWFTLPSGEALVPPPKYKMATIVWISIFPLSIIVNSLLSPFIGHLPLVLRIAIITLVLVLLMTYLVMPWMSKLFHRWLHCNK